MLPDFPRLKSDIQDRLTEYVELRTYANMGRLGDLEKRRIPEGNAQVTIWADGTRNDVSMRRASATVTITDDEMRHLTLAGVVSKMNQVADDLAASMSQGLYQSLDEVTTKTGMTVDAKGQRLTIEHLLEMLEKLHVDFDQDGTPRLPELHVHPKLGETLRAVVAQIHDDPIIRSRFAETLEAKREEWRAREADRKLVG